MTRLDHGHGTEHAYVTGTPTVEHGHGIEHGYVTAVSSRKTAGHPRHEIPADGPMTLRYVRNPGTSTSHGNFGELYGQHVEPHGRYLSERSGDHAPEGWETGEVHFHNPLHVPFGGGYQEPSNWKHQLSDRYDGKRGKALSRAVAKDGHDAIVTHDDYGTSEIVDLTHLHKRSGKTASIPDHQRELLSTSDSDEGKRGRLLDLARNPKPGTHIWRGEVRHKDDLAAPGSVGMHWSVNPTSMVLHSNRDLHPDHRRVMWQATVDEPDKQSIPRSHKIWSGRDQSFDSEAEVRLHPQAKVRINGAYVFHGDEDMPAHGSATVSPDPTKPHEIARGWEFHPMDHHADVVPGPTKERYKTDYPDLFGKASAPAQDRAQRPQECNWGNHPATHSLRYEEGRHGYISSCDEHAQKSRDAVKDMGEQVQQVHRLGRRVEAVSVSWDHHDDDPGTWSQDYHSWAKEKPHAVAVSQAQEHVRRHVPTMGMDLGSGEDATSAMQHMLRKGGHPDHEEGFVMKHPSLGWGQSQAFTSDGQPGVSLHPSKWDYGTLAHETAHHLHEHELGRKPHNDAEAHGPDFIRHYQSLLGDFGRGAADKLGEKYHESLGRLQGRTARRVASGHPFIHVSPREFKPGDKIEPADDHGGESTFDYSDLDKVYLSHPDHAEYWGNTVGAAGGHKEVHHYEVEPHEHPEFQISSDDEEEYTASGATVKRKLRTQKVDPRAYTKRQIHPSLLAGGEGWGKEHDRSESQYAQRVPSWERKGAKEPNQRLFGPTYGLDHRLFEGEHLKDDVRRYILETLGEFWKPLHGYSWDEWARVYFAGSEASEWTSESLEGNGDFDVLIGVDYDKFRANACRCHPAGTDEEITAQLNEELRNLDAKTENAMIMVDGEMTGPWNQTWYVNKDSFDIRRIKPYAAYNVTDDEWAVRPPHLPNWSIEQFPEGHPLVQEARAVEAYVRAVLKLPEPYRSQQATALWEHLHSDRGRAFGPQGEGWFDPSNVIEKWLDQRGVWEKLVRVRMDARDHPEKLNAPADWSNTPPPAPVH